MHESGYMEELDKNWILLGGDKCDNKNEKFPATLGLKNMAVGAGIVGGVGLIIIEIIYKKQQTRKQCRLEAAQNAADKWRGTIERKTLRTTLMNQKRPKSNGMEAFTVKRGMKRLMTTPTTTTRTPLSSTIANMDAPPPPPRAIPPASILPSILTVDIPPNDPDIHGIPPPPPPPASSLAVRMRSRRVIYASRNHPEYESRDASV